MILMPLVIQLITADEIAELEALFGPITVTIPQLIESRAEMPEPTDPHERHEYYQQMMESNVGPVAR